MEIVRDITIGAAKYRFGARPRLAEFCLLENIADQLKCKKDGEQTDHSLSIAFRRNRLRGQEEHSGKRSAHDKFPSGDSAP